MNLVAEKKDRLLSQGGESLKIKTKPSLVFSTTLEKTKGEILSLIGTGPLKKTSDSSEKVEYPITGERLKNLNKVNTMLKAAFESSTKEDYTKWYQRLPDFMKTPIKEGYYKVLVSNVRKNEIVVCLGKMGNDQLKFSIPEKDLIGKGYLRGDEIVVQLTKKDGQTMLKQVDERWLTLQNENLLNKNISYLPVNKTNTIEWKVVWLSQDPKGEQVLFQSKQWNQFSLKLSTLLDGMKKAKLMVSVPKEEKKEPVQQKSSSSSEGKVVYNGSLKSVKPYPQPRGWDGEKITY